VNVCVVHNHGLGHGDSGGETEQVVETKRTLKYRGIMDIMGDSPNPR
jgi:hypothetical protein